MHRDKVTMCLHTVDASPSRRFLGIRHFIIGCIMTVASEEARMRKEKTFMNKLNLILVQVCSSNPDLGKSSRSFSPRIEKRVAS
jgi:hypothetical protein